MAMEMKTSVLLCAALLCLTYHRARAQDSNSPSQCQQEEPAGRKACFVDRGLDLATIPRNLDVTHPLFTLMESTFTMMDPTVFCSNPTLYYEAARCAVNISKSCYDPDGTLDNIMDPDHVVMGMQVLCNKQQEVNMECFKNFYLMVDECTQYHHRAGGPAFASMDTKDIICAKEDLKYDCMEVLMKPMCGMNTTHVFLEQLDKYQVIPRCVNGSEPSRQRTRYFTTLEHENNNDNRGGGSALVINVPVVSSLVVMALICLLN